MGFRVWLKRLLACEGSTLAAADTFTSETFWRSVCSLKKPVLLVRGADLQILSASEEAYELFGLRNLKEMGTILVQGLDPFALSRVQLAVVNPVFLVAGLPIHVPTSDRQARLTVTVTHLPEYPGGNVALLMFNVAKTNEFPIWARVTRELLARLPHPAWVTDIDGHLVFSNASFSEFPLEFIRTEALPAEMASNQAEWSRLTQIQSQLCAMPMKLRYDDSLSDQSYDLGAYGRWRILHFPLKSQDNKNGLVGVLTMREDLGVATLADVPPKWQSLRGVMRPDALAHVLQVRETERAAIAREIHDSLGQELTVLKLSLRRLASQALASQAVPGQVQEHFKSVSQLVDNLTQSTRRIAYELRQDLVKAKGLAHTVQDLILDLRNRLSLPIQLEIAPNWVEPEEGMAHHMHRSLQEMLNNVSKHAKASRCLVRLGREPTHYWVEVQDDGVGIAIPSETGSIGLRSLNERAAIYGGRVIIRTRPEVAGAIVRLELPERRNAPVAAHSVAGCTAAE